MRYSTGINKYPSGRFGFVGSVPVALCREDGQSNVYNTEQEAINDLLRIGITRFQKSDCSWFEPTAWQRIEAAGRNVPVEVTEEEYWDALEVLPPIYIKGASWFAVMEPVTHTGQGMPVFHCFAQIEGKYWGTLATVPDAREAFNKILNKDVLLEGTVKEFEAAAESGQTVSLFGLSQAIRSEGGAA